MLRAQDSLQNGIEDRQNELRNLVRILGGKAYDLQRVSNILRVATILLSAITTAKGVADSAFGQSNSAVLAIFTIVGIATTVLLGLEAAFKFEKRSAEITLLAATCQATVILVDSEWRKKIGSEFGVDLRSAARDILTLQDSKLADIHQKAASLGLNLVHQIRNLEDPDDVPYAA